MDLETLMGLALDSNLCREEKYDVEKHGDMDCEDGDNIYWWGE